jgi:hypothetical protein
MSQNITRQKVINHHFTTEIVKQNDLRFEKKEKIGTEKIAVSAETIVFLKKLDMNISNTFM